MHNPWDTLAYYVHNLDPYIFKIGSWGPRWYGLAYLTGFLGAYLLIKKNARDGMLRLKPSLVADLVLNCCIFGVLIGGRLGFVLFYDLPISLQAGRTPMLWNFSTDFPFWGALKVWDGGMAAHGGIIFSILTIMVFSWHYLGKPTRGQIARLIAGTFVFGTAGWFLAFFISGDPSVEVASAMVLAITWMAFYGRRHAIPAINIGDAACMVVPIGLFFGRCANFINGELYGHPTNVPWAVKFPSEIYSPTNNKIDPDVLEKLDPILNVSHYDLINHDQLYDKALNSLSQKLAEHDPHALSQVAPILPPRHPSQLYEALLEGALLFAICYIIGRRWKKDGMASGAFLTFYPIMRIIGEQFRIGDTPVNIFGMEISKGVLYSVPMVIAGAIYWGYFIRTSKPNIWVPQQEEPAADKKGSPKPA